MAIALVNKLGTNSAGSSITSLAVTLTVGVAQNDTIIVASGWGASTGGTVTVTDSRSNTYTQRFIQTSSTAGNLAIFEAPASTALQIGDTITIHYTTAVSNPTIAAYDFSGLIVNSFDVSQTANATSTNPDTGATATTAQANELLFGVVIHTGFTYTAGTGYTALDSGITPPSGHILDTEYQVVAATGAYHATWTGSSTAWNAAIATFKASAGSAPVNTVAPAVSGTQHVGQTLTTTNGTWTDDGSPTFTYQWQRDNAGGGTYSNITGETASTHVLVAADDGCNVRCVVTDNTLDGNTSANSNALAITYAAPTNTVAPVVSGNATVGAVLSCDTGTWTT